MSVIINTTKSELEEVIRYARIGANNCMIGDGWGINELVRCEDCKHWDDVPADETQDHECHLFDGNEEKIRIATPSAWFCPMESGEANEMLSELY